VYHVRVCVRVDEDRTPDREPHAPYYRGVRHQRSTALILPAALVLTTVLVVVLRLLTARLTRLIGFLLVVGLTLAVFLVLVLILVLVVVVRIGPILRHGDVLIGGCRRGVGPREFANAVPMPQRRISTLRAMRESLAGSTHSPVFSAWNAGGSTIFSALDAKRIPIHEIGEHIAKLQFTHCKAHALSCNFNLH
jgi:hypothetical protein